MNDITDRSLMTALGRQMTRAVAKQTVSAGNLANLDTPGFKTKEATFDDALSEQLEQPMLVSTRANHLAGEGSGPGMPKVSEVDGLPVRRDGNNVELDRELLSMARASGDFARAQTALSAKFRLIRYAIQESK